MNNKKFSVFVAIVALFLLIGCSSKTIVKKAPRTDFLKGIDQSHSSKSLPFDHDWEKKGVKFSGYTKIIIKPVRLDYLPKNTWEDNKSPIFKNKEKFDATVKEIGEYFVDKLERRFNKKKNNHYQVVKAAGPKTLMLELAFIEIRFSRPLRYAGSVAIPLPGSSQVIGSVTPPALSIAGKVTDSETGEVFLSFSDRETPPVRIIDFNRFTATSPIRDLCGRQAKIIAAVLNRKEEDKVSRSGKFDIVPW